MSENKYPLTVQEFQEWLESKNENEVVGEMGDASSCPLANALRQKAKFVRVKADITVTNNCFIFSNPDWVEKFVRKIDSLSDDSKSVTAQEALKILSGVEKYDLFD